MSKIIDLTLTLTTESGVMIGHPTVRLQPIQTHAVHGRANTSISLSLHTGTHVDAPFHFFPNGAGIEKVSLDRLIGPAVMFDLRGIAKSDVAITLADLRKAPGFREGLKNHIVVFHTGWVKDHFGKPTYYMENPYLALETAEWLVKQEISALAGDHSVDRVDGDPKPGDYPIHRMFLGSGIPFIEHLDKLEEISQSEFEMIALPIKVEGADGAPARVVARLS